MSRSCSVGAFEPVKAYPVFHISGKRAKSAPISLAFRQQVSPLSIFSRAPAADGAICNNAIRIMAPRSRSVPVRTSRIPYHLAEMTTLVRHRTSGAAKRPSARAYLIDTQSNSQLEFEFWKGLSLNAQANLSAEEAQTTACPRLSNSDEDEGGPGCAGAATCEGTGPPHGLARGMSHRSWSIGPAGEGSTPQIFRFSKGAETRQARQRPVIAGGGGEVRGWAVEIRIICQQTGRKRGRPQPSEETVAGTFTAAGRLGRRMGRSSNGQALNCGRDVRRNGGVRG